MLGIDVRVVLGLCLMLGLVFDPNIKHKPKTNLGLC